MKHRDLTKNIINAAYNVYNALGKGFLEKVYENALTIELKEKGINVIQQAPIITLYKNKIVGDYIADLLIEEKVIVELKAIKELKKIHEVQLVNYLAATKIELGLLLNFGENFELKRKIFSHK